VTSGYTPAIGERITELLTAWKLTAAATELVPRLSAAGHDEALALLADVLELEASTRSERRVDRLRKASKLPPAKNFETLDRASEERRLPRRARHEASTTTTLGKRASGRRNARPGSLDAPNVSGVGRPTARGRRGAGFSAAARRGDRRGGAASLPAPTPRSA
jgi:hypothetical protein